MSDDNGGSFGSGFFLGLLSGAAGLLFFQSERGQALWEQLKRELEPKVEELMADEDVRALAADAEAIVEKAAPAVKKNLSKFPKFKAKL